MFEVIDLANIMGIIPIITFNNNETATDMADFIEYCWGNETTEYGQKRISDGHPNVYNISWIEIGNEQKLTQLYLQQFINITTVMESKINDMNKLGYNI